MKLLIERKALIKIKKAKKARRLYWYSKSSNKKKKTEIRKSKDQK